MPIKSSITSGVEIIVKPIFRKDLSNPENNTFVYNYHITIKNDNKYPIQLLSRKWVIKDSLNQPLWVEGEGVIGQQPTLFAGESFEYISGAEINGFIGEMYGQYTFKNSWENKLFEVDIPVFKLEYPSALN